MGCRRDSHNDMDLENAVILLKEPEMGGKLWIEDESLHHTEAEWKQVSKKMWKKGKPCLGCWTTFLLQSSKMA